MSLAQRRAARKQREEEKKGPPSLFDQAKGALAGFVPGLINLGVTAGKQALSVPRVGVELVRGEADLADVGSALYGVTPLGMGQAQAESAASEFAGHDVDWNPLTSPESRQRYMPFTAEMGASSGRTASRLRHPERYKQAYEEGQLFGAMLEDLGNVAMVAGAAAPVLGAAGRGVGAGGVGVRGGARPWDGGG